MSGGRLQRPLINMAMPSPLQTIKGNTGYECHLQALEQALSCHHHWSMSKIDSSKLGDFRMTALFYHFIFRLECLTGRLLFRLD